MSSQKSSSSWQWSESRKQHYFIDTSHNTLVFEDGTEFSAPRNPSAAQPRPEQPRTIPTQQQQLNTVTGQQGPQQSRNRPSSSRFPQRTAATMAESQRMQVNGNPGTERRPPFQLDRVQEKTDAATKVTSKIAYGQNGEKVLLGTNGRSELLDNSYQIQSNPRNFFTVGRVFLTLWTEPTTASVTFVTPVKYGENAFCRIRRFVVYREGLNYCNVVPIHTYSGRGLAKRSAVASEHGYVYIEGRPPQARPSDAGIMNVALRIDPVKKSETIKDTARINFGKTYTVEHNLKVKEFGTVVNVGDLQRAVSSVSERQLQRAQEIPTPLNTGDQSSKAQQPGGQGSRATIQARDPLAGASRSANLSNARGAYPESIASSQDSRRATVGSDDDDEDDEDGENDGQESEEESDEERDPRNKKSQQVEFRGSVRGRGGYGGSQRTRGQPAYQYSQR